ncbi:SDR family oxidoreductase [Lichenicoccus roseus]|uniref:SDR family oxidoreductase n=1 Tax=Lichenicoccus roseus TaxID=2683649 RepID=A0A5R9JEC3_9PROT|nr:SDR family oxidoreductase [Lichenicoccus roseus]TLU73756.1 SDR family oxidoreductase [Lichenicoccus roseus]
MNQDPRSNYPTPPFSQPKIDPPGSSAEMTPKPDHGESSYRGSGKLEGQVALITGGDSGIGRAVAIAFAREGADVAISFLDESADARDTIGWIEEAGRRALALPGDITSRALCRGLVEKVVAEFGRIDILVNNAAFQRTHEKFEEIDGDEWELTFATNVHAMFHLTQAAVPHMRPGSTIINTTSVNADMPPPTMIAYDATKGAISNFTGGAGQLLAKQGIRMNAVAPGPIWTPLIPSTMDADSVKNFGAQTPLGRPGQPAELAAAYVLLASNESSYMSGAIIPVTGGRPIL